MKKILIALAILMFCAPAYAAGKFTVQGTVSYRSGAPAAGLTVQVLQRAGKHKQPQGSAVTAANGAYRISYTPRTAPDGATIFVRVLNKKGKPIHTSRPIKHAGPSETLNLRLP